MILYLRIAKFKESIPKIRQNKFYYDTEDRLGNKW